MLAGVVFVGVLLCHNGHDGVVFVLYCTGIFSFVLVYFVLCWCTILCWCFLCHAGYYFVTFWCAVLCWCILCHARYYYVLVYFVLCGVLFLCYAGVLFCVGVFCVMQGTILERWIESKIIPLTESVERNGYRFTW